MNSAQKVIKYIAIGFGAFLSINIIVGIITAIALVGSIFTGVSWYENSSDLIEETITITEQINDIDIDVSISKITIKEGEEFRVETKSIDNDLKVEVNNNTLSIKDNKSFRFFTSNEEVIIYIPKDIEFDTVHIDSGVGELYIETIVANKVDMKLGVGSTKIRELISKRTTKIDGGVGKIEINSGSLNNLDLSSGIGECAVNAKLTGDSKIDNGIGKVRLTIDGDIEDYTIKTDTGIGTISINNTTCSDNGTYGNGDYEIKVSGGIGAMEIVSY